MLTLGTEECLSFASTLGVMDLTLPALDNEPCDGTVSHSFNILLNLLAAEILINIHKFGCY